MVEIELLIALFSLSPNDNILFSCTTYKEGETMSKKHDYCGTCMFCNSVCPECSSTDVDVSGHIRFSYRNYAQDEIDMDIKLMDVNLECNDCGAGIGLDLENLKDAIADALPDSLKAKRKDDNIVTISI